MKLTLKSMLLLLLAVGLVVYVFHGKSLRRKFQRQMRKLQNAEMPHDTFHGGRPAAIKLPPDPDLHRETDVHDETGTPLPLQASRRFGSLRFRQGGAVSAVFFASDSKTLISGGADQAISWWDTRNGREVRRVANWREPGQLIPLPDGELFVSVEQSAPVYLVRRVSDGRVLRRLLGADASDKLFACSHDQRWFASAGPDNSVQVWNAVSGAPWLCLKGFEQPIRAISFLGGGSRIIVVARSGKFQQWDVASGRTLKTGILDRFSTCALAQDGSRLAAAESGRISLWDLENGAMLAVVPLRGRVLAWSHDLTKIAAADDSGNLKVWDTASQTVTFSASTTAQFLISICFSPDGRLLAAGDSSGLIRVWDLNIPGEIFPQEGHTASIRSLSFSHDGRALLSLGDEGVIRKWDLLTGKELSSLRLGQGNGMVKALSGDRALIVHPGQFEVRATDDWKTLVQAGQKHFSGGWSYCPFAASRDGAWVAVTGRTAAMNASGTDTMVVQVWKIAEMAVAAEFPLPVRFAGLALSPDGSELAVTSSGDDQSLFVYDVRGGRELYELKIPTRMGYTSLPVYSPTGQLIVGGGSYEPGGRAQLTASTGAVVSFPWCMGMFPGNEMVSPDGLWIANRDWRDSTVIEVGPSPWLMMPSYRLSGHRGMVTAVAFSPGGRYLASGGRDSTVLLWDLTAGESYETVSEEIGTETQELTELLPEAPIDVPPIFSFHFEGYIGTETFGLTSLGEGASGHEFAPGRSGMGLSLTSREPRVISIPEGEDVILPDCWSVEFWLRIENEWEEDSYLEVVDCDLFSLVLGREGQADFFYRFPRRGGHGSFKLPERLLEQYGRWHHLSAVWEGPRGRLRLYLDGRQIADSPQARLATSVGNLSFGRGAGSAENRVVIDDLRFFRHARSAEEVARENLHESIPGAGMPLIDR